MCVSQKGSFGCLISSTESDSVPIEGIKPVTVSSNSALASSTIAGSLAYKTTAPVVRPADNRKPVIASASINFLKIRSLLAVWRS